MQLNHRELLVLCRQRNPSCSRPEIMSQDGVRRRPIGEEQDNTRQAASAKPGSSAIRVSGEKTATSQADTDFGVLDVLRMLAGLLLLSCLLSYFVTNDSFLWGWRPWFVRPALVVRYLVRRVCPL